MGQAIEREIVRLGTPFDQEGGIDQTTFRRVLGTFASGVTVVTVAHEGVAHGSTVASFCSLSLDPPLVLVCITKGNVTHDLIERAGAFNVNILGEGGEQLSRHFASRQPDKFAGVAHTVGLTGAPLLSDALATLECQLVEQLPGGDHSIFIGRVLAAEASDEGNPLLYFRSGYRALA